MVYINYSYIYSHHCSKYMKIYQLWNLILMLWRTSKIINQYDLCHLLISNLRQYSHIIHSFIDQRFLHCNFRPHAGHRLCVLLSVPTACGINEFLYLLVLWCGCLSRPLRSIWINSTAKGWVASLSIFLAFTVSLLKYSSSKSLCRCPVTCPAFLVILFSLDLSLSVTFPPQQTTQNKRILLMAAL